MTFSSSSETSFHKQLLNRFRETLPETSFQITQEDAERLDRLARLSPIYHSVLLNHPEFLPWLLEPPNSGLELPVGTFRVEWKKFLNTFRDEDEKLVPMAALRVFRRKICVRIAYRDINHLQAVQYSVAEHSRLAEFCLRECYQTALAQWRARYGEPWEEEAGRPARFCVLALGKLGGQELNFSSDIDLIYIYEGEGFCRKEDRTTHFSNAQFFTKVAETLTHLLQDPTEHGFMFRVDLRLRPEGRRSLLIRSFASTENYYAVAGQSWERMALLKARPVAGNLELGGELLESLHSFRYPRHPPDSLLAEIASMKLRTEREVVGAANLTRDVKRGLGGIREIEFIVQTMQLLHAGRFPFLQTHSTGEGLTQLVRYRLMEKSDADFLRSAYWFLRDVEHRIQVREEQQTHVLPQDREQLAAIAESFGLPSAEAFETKLSLTRSGVRGHYAKLLQSTPADVALTDWWTYFSENKALPTVGDSLRRWFGKGADDPHSTLRDFVQGSRNYTLLREQVVRFVGLTKQFDRVMALLAYPLRTLQRITRFADAYGTRSQFLSTCALDPRFFEVLALLFDRSEFICNLLCRYPEIFEEVLRPEILRRRKNVVETVRELQFGAPTEEFEDWLWLYVKAEQIRIAIGELLGFLDQKETEENLTVLADAVLTFLLRRVDPRGHLLIVALGKYGGGEMNFGSDVDLLILGGDEAPQQDTRAIQSLVKLLSHRTAHGPIFSLDLRLRPYGKDGPLVISLSGLRNYHQRHAQFWEKQALTRARVVTGSPALAISFTQFVDKLLYKAEAPHEEMRALWEMRLRIERERDQVQPPERAFKTGPGGLVDLEFFAQLLQLHYGHLHPEFQQPNTRKVLEEALEFEILEASEAHLLLDNLHFLRSIEVQLRRNDYTAVSVIPESDEEQFALARWSRFSSFDDFWGKYCHAMLTTRQIIATALNRDFQIDLIPTPDPF